MKSITLSPVLGLLMACSAALAETPMPSLHEPRVTACEVKAAIEQEIEQLTLAESELRQRLASLTTTVAEQSALLADAERLAVDFRAAFQQGEASEFPVTVKGESYSRERLLSQTQLLLAQIEGHQTTLRRLSTVRKQAEAEAAALAVVINYQKSQGVALAVDELLLNLRSRSVPVLVMLQTFDRQVVEQLKRDEGSHMFEIAKQLSGPAERKARWIVSDADVAKFLSTRVLTQADQQPAAKPTATLKPEPASKQENTQPVEPKHSVKQWPCARR
jgi:hypothetical protein